MNVDVDVVIVTYNRLEKLKKTLQCYENQTQTFRNLIVVNNHSTDGTSEYLKEWSKKETPFGKHVITTNENLGGAGGFYTGQKKAMTMQPDWVFIADDDAYPEPDMMQRFCEFTEGNDISRYAAICAAVYNPDNTLDVSHRSRYEVRQGKYFTWNSSTEEDYQKPFFKIDFLSYVGSFLNVNALKKVGLVNPKFFIYNDDSEHSLRLRKYGELICVPTIKIVHDVKKVGQVNYQVTDDNVLVTWGDYYTNRNEMYMFKKHIHSLAKYRFKTALKRHLKGKEETEYDKIKWIAYRDAWLGKLGRHSVYQPGWSIRKSDLKK